jgi:hypothetical protein
VIRSTFGLHSLYYDNDIVCQLAGCFAQAYAQALNKLFKSNKEKASPGDFVLSLVSVCLPIRLASLKQRLSILCFTVLQASVPAGQLEMLAMARILICVNTFFVKILCRCDVQD